MDEPFGSNEKSRPWHGKEDKQHNQSQLKNNSIFKQGTHEKKIGRHNRKQDKGEDDSNIHKVNV
jgi:hypothetical protein